MSFSGGKKKGKKKQTTKPKTDVKHSLHLCR